MQKWNMCKCKSKISKWGMDLSHSHDVSQSCHDLVLLWIMQVRPHSRFCFVSFEDCVSERLRDIDANNIVALCSCLVFDEKSEDPITNNLDLMKAFETCKGIARNVAEDNGQGLSRSNISIHFQQSPAEDDWRCWKSCWYFQCCWSFGLIELLLFSDFSGWEQKSHWRGRICAEAEAAADGCGFALVGRQTISRNHDSRKLA